MTYIYTNPILVAPFFSKDPFFIPFSSPPPRALCEEHSIPATFASVLSKMALVHEEAPTGLTFVGGMDADGHPLEVFAPYLPDLHVVVHYEKPSRATLTRDVITELRVQGGVFSVLETPIAARIPRARYYDFRHGGQGFQTELELALVLLQEGAADETWAHEVSADILSHMSIIQSQPNERYPIWNAGALVWLDALDALGIEDAAVANARGTFLRLLLEDQESLLNKLKAQKILTPSPPSALTALRDTLGPLPQLEATLKTLGPGLLSADVEIFPVLGSAGILVRTKEAQEKPDWPQEFVVIGSYQGAPLCLDTRYQPCPLVGTEEGMICEMSDSLLGFLAF